MANILSPLSVIILAAGKGTRMKSAFPKVLHQLAGKPLINHVYDTAISIGAESVCVVYGHEGEMLLHNCKNFKCHFAEQKEQLGTGHAVDHALPYLSMNDTVLILYGDVPLTSEQTLKNLLDKVDDDTIGLLTVNLDDPHGYGRIVRDGAKNVKCIVEQKDASPQQLKISEVNTGIMALKADLLRDMLAKINNENAQGEYYLTDVIGLAVDAGKKIETCFAANEYEVAGVNSRVQLAELERVYQKNHAIKLMESGVTLADPERIDVRGNISVGQDIFIDSNVTLSGDVSIEDFVQIGQGCVISDSTIGAGSIIKPYSVIENSTIGSQVEVGPFARVRPGTEMAAGSKVGNFVETKKAIIGEGTKISHLSYVGDAELGKNINIGAGTITCNYDGVNKHKTIIKDNAFIGSDTQLVAPVTVGEGVTVAAGSTITKDTSDGVLVLSRTKQKEIAGWKRPEKIKSDE
ncbi:MAG: bifunctional UDP-N-acetylglucosamine diphosphorylase/glucosamine-1-phosphate N-acetyltransferase GlmU [Gammaproteobacteria bacterium]|nr:bifunctional UDP-N-acetylglucosamine diphosphorylase/glucosamine-1-phosphate N-acetyltransferase GlmU [Gammaproteobacteria bacterium]